MYKYFVLLIIALSSKGFVSAQATSTTNWQPNSDGSIEYNCALVETIDVAIQEGNQQAITDVLDTTIAKLDDGTELSVLQYVGSTVLLYWTQDSSKQTGPDDVFGPAALTCNRDETADEVSTEEDLFTVKVNGNINLRSCAGTDCEIVKTAQDGSLLTVIGQEGDWYKVRLDEGPAYVASWLTVRGPDAIIAVGTPYVDPATGCIVVFDRKRGDMNMALILSGDKRNDLYVDLYRPNETRPLRVEGQLDKTFMDTGDPYIHQYYSWSVGWPTGTYQLEISVGDQTSRLAWEMSERGDYNIYVMCD